MKTERSAWRRLRRRVCAAVCACLCLAGSGCSLLEDEFAWLDRAAPVRAPADGTVSHP